MAEELTPEQVRELEQQLRDRREYLRGEIRDELQRMENEHYSDLAGNVHDSGDESVADMLSDLQYGIVDRQVEEMRAIEAALQRIREGRYGHCQVCDEPIEVARLKAQPTATRCLEHQAEYERNHEGAGAPGNL